MTTLNNIYGWLAKLGCINEAVVERRGQLLTEADTKVKQLRNIIANVFPNLSQQEVKDKTKKFMHDFALSNDEYFHLLKNAGKIAYTELGYEQPNEDDEKIQYLKEILKLVKSSQENFDDFRKPDTTYETLWARYGQYLEDEEDRKRNEALNKEYTRNANYCDPILIKSREEAFVYGKYSGLKGNGTPDSGQLCFTTSDSQWNYFTKGGTRECYVSLTNDWQNIPAKKTDGYPKDAYGLSQVWFFIDRKMGKMTNSNVRWNHGYGGYNADDMFEVTELCDLLGINMYKEYGIKSSRQLIKEFVESLKNGNPDESCYSMRWCRERGYGWQTKPLEQYHICSLDGIGDNIYNKNTNELVWKHNSKWFEYVSPAFENVNGGYVTIVRFKQGNGDNLLDLRTGKLIYDESGSGYKFNYFYHVINNAITDHCLKAKKVGSSEDGILLLEPMWGYDTYDIVAYEELLKNPDFPDSILFFKSSPVGEGFVKMQSTEEHRQFYINYTDKTILRPDLYIYNGHKFIDGKAQVEVKENVTNACYMDFIDAQGNLLINNPNIKWFSLNCDRNDGGYLIYVKIGTKGNKENYMDRRTYQLLYDDGTDECGFKYIGHFNHQDVALVEKRKGCQNLLRRDGQLVSKKWFGKIDTEFHSGWVRVHSGTKGVNYVDINGNLISKSWFSHGKPFDDNGRAEVGIGGVNGYGMEYNILRADGTLGITEYNEKYHFLGEVNDNIYVIYNRTPQEGGKNFNLYNIRTKRVVFPKTWFSRISKSDDLKSYGNYWLVANSEYSRNILDGDTMRFVSPVWFVGVTYVRNDGVPTSDGLLYRVGIISGGQKYINILNITKRKLLIPIDSDFSCYDGYLLTGFGDNHYYTYVENEDEKMNIMRSDGKLVSPNQWFDQVSFEVGTQRLPHQYACVRMGQLRNIITSKGKIVFKKWHKFIKLDNGFICGADINEGGQIAITEIIKPK